MQQRCIICLLQQSDMGLVFTSVDVILVSVFKCEVYSFVCTCVSFFLKSPNLFNQPDETQPVAFLA